MIRGIHPVGAGTFITELHCLKQVVVYDCGNGKGISKNDFHMIIDRAFEKVKHISLMFISHFDKDHVSGVEYLIEKGYLNRNSKVYLPLIQNKEIDLYYLFDSEFVYRDIIELLSNNEIPVIYVKPNSNREEEDNNDENENTILSFRKINLADKWLYIPFYLQDNSLLHTFAKYVAASPNPFTSQELENFAALSTSRRKELKKKYNAFKKGKAYGGITHINMNAMLLISKPIDENKNFYGTLFQCIVSAGSR